MNLRKKFSGQIMVFRMFLVAIGFGMISGTVFQFTKIREYNSEIANLNNQLETTQKQIDTLQNTEDNTDLESLEEIARTKLNMVKPDEIIYIVTD